MSEQDPTQSQRHERMEVAALGVCIARTLAASDPTMLRRFAEEADRMHQHLIANDRPEWAEVLVAFGLAVGRPELFPLFHPPAALKE